MEVQTALYRRGMPFIRSLLKDHIVSTPWTAFCRTSTNQLLPWLIDTLSASNKLRPRDETSAWANSLNVLLWHIKPVPSIMFKYLKEKKPSSNPMPTSKSDSQGPLYGATHEVPPHGTCPDKIHIGKQVVEKPRSAGHEWSQLNIIRRC